MISKYNLEVCWGVGNDIDVLGNIFKKKYTNIKQTKTKTEED